MSSWKYESGDFSRFFNSGGRLNRSEKYVNQSGDSKVTAISLLGYSGGRISISISIDMVSQDESSVFRAALSGKHPSINILEPCLGFEKKVEVSLESLLSPERECSLVLEFINNFEKIQPIATFVRMKKALGLKLSESISFYSDKIQLMYAEDDFDKALSLALECKEAGMEGLVEGLSLRCLEASDYENLIKSISYECSQEYIYNLAHELFMGAEVEGVMTKRARLKIAMNLFDMCSSYKDANKLKANIFAELSGKSLHEPYVTLGLKLPAEYLARVADMLINENSSSNVVGRLATVLTRAEAGTGTGAAHTPI